MQKLRGWVYLSHSEYHFICLGKCLTTSLGDGIFHRALTFYRSLHYRWLRNQFPESKLDKSIRVTEGYGWRAYMHN